MATTYLALCTHLTYKSASYAWPKMRESQSGKGDVKKLFMSSHFQVHFLSFNMFLWCSPGHKLLNEPTWALFRHLFPGWRQLIGYINCLLYFTFLPVAILNPSAHKPKKLDATCIEQICSCFQLTYWERYKPFLITLKIREKQTASLANKINTNQNQVVI